MILKNKSFILSLLILSCIVVIIIYNQDTMKTPTPTEYVEKKKILECRLQSEPKAVNAIDPKCGCCLKCER